MITKAASGDTAHQAASVSGNAQWEGLGARVLSAVVLGSAIVSVVYIGSIAFFAAVIVFAVLMAHEWNKLSNGNYVSIFTGGHALITGAVILLVGSNLYTIALEIFFAGMLVLAVAAVILKRPVSWPVLGIFYIAIPISSLIWLRQSEPLGVTLVLWSFAVVWVTDTGAYVFGKAIGGPRLAPRISPKKTWAGLIGGTLCGTAAGGIVAAVSELAPVWILAGLSFGLTFAAHGGDLVESVIKRHFGVKDSGTIIPGHGGVLDRVDGLIFVWPVMAGAQLLCEGFLPWVAQ